MPTSSEQNKKRKIQDISKNGKENKQTQSLLVQKSTNQRDKSQPKNHDNGKKNKDSLKENIKGQAKKPLTEKKMKEILEQNEIELDGNKQDLSQQVIVGNMFSLFALVEKQPQKLKTVIDEIFKHEDNSVEFIVKTMFLYFLELMGLAEKSDLEYYCHFIAKNEDETKLNQLFTSSFDVSFDKTVFFSTDKKAIVQKKLLKKICKIFIADVVDDLPEKERYLTSIVERVCVFSKNPQRLVRYTFSYIGMYLYKFLLSQYKGLVTLREQLKQKSKNQKSENHDDKLTQREITAIKSAMDITKESFSLIQRIIIQKRSQDSQELVRKSIFDFLLQLDNQELAIAFDKTNIEMYNLVFNSIRDADPQIAKTGLQIIFGLLQKLNGDKETQKLLDDQIMKNKLQIFKMAIPNKNSDNNTTIKALQVIKRMIQQNPEVFKQEQIQMIYNLVHSSVQSIKEEAVLLLLEVTSEFDNANSLLELQKINPQKNNYDEFTLNFNEEPNKSQKQILKLINIFEKHVQTRSQYLKSGNKGEDNEEVIVPPNMEKTQVQKILDQDCEERAVLLFQTFFRTTSVVYDIQSMIHLIKKEDISTQTQQTLANLMFISLIHTNSMRSLKDSNNLIYNKIWESSTGYLKLTVLNELIQTFRVNMKILEPLLKCMLLVSKYLEKDSSNDLSEELGKDITYLLLKIFAETEVNEVHSETEQIARTCVLNLVQLLKVYPQIQKELQELVLDYNERLKHEVIPQLFRNENQISNDILSFIFKFNILMTKASLKEIADSDYLKGMCSFGVSNFTHMMTDNLHTLRKLSRYQLTQLLQIPYQFMEQLLNDSQQEQDHINYQRKLTVTLIEFYLELHYSLKGHEDLQLVTLQMTLDSLVLASGSEQTNRYIIIEMHEVPKSKEFLLDIISSVAERIKGQDSVVMEQFQLLNNFFIKDLQAFLSDIGLHYLRLFGTSKDQTVLKEIRRLYQSYKQRDSLITDTKKSIFYSLIFKVIMTIAEGTNDNQILRMLDMSPEELKKEHDSDELNKFISIDQFGRMKASNIFIKNMINSIMLSVLQMAKQSSKEVGAPHQYNLSKSQDEFAYLKLIEDLCKVSFNSPKSYVMLMSVKSLLHKNMTGHKYYDNVVQGIEGFIDKVQQKQNLEENDVNILKFILNMIKEKGQPKKTKKSDETIEDEDKENDSKENNDGEMMIDTSSKPQIKPKNQVKPRVHVSEKIEIGKKRVTVKMNPNQPKSSDAKKAVVANDKKVLPKQDEKARQIKKTK